MNKIHHFKIELNGKFPKEEMRKKWKDLHLPMSLSLNPQQPPEKTPVCHHDALLSSPSLHPEAHGVKACLQVPSSEDHETRPVLEKAVWHPELQGRSWVHRAQLVTFCPCSFSS